MPTILKFVVYFVVLGVLLVIQNSIPKSGEPLKGLFAFLAVGWMIGGVFIVMRGIFRFITR
jgi:hypothetical protein